MIPTVEDILSRITEYCRNQGIAESTFGVRVVNDGDFVRRLRAGGTMTLKTLHRIEAALAHPVNNNTKKKKRMS